ncbi:hypothetical protein D3C83_225380 [compost metagenome]
MLTEQPAVDDGGSNISSVCLLHPQLDPPLIQEEKIPTVHGPRELGVRRRHAARAADQVTSDDVKLVAGA